jgi:D-alanyl-D-alanine carboxypeptidase
MQAAVRGVISSRLAAAMTAAALVALLGGCTGATDPPDQQSPAPQSAAPTERPAPAFATVLERYSEDTRAQGATAVVIQMKSRVGEWSSAEGLRSLEGKEPVQLTDQTQIGDITMTMVAVSVMKLVEEGKIELDDPITRYLPDFESIIKPPGPVSIRNLLNHRSGMPHYWESPLDIGNRRFTHEERLGFAAAIPWTRSPRPFYRYSNTNYSALALLVEKLRGKDIGAVIQADNVQPLGLKDTLMSGSDPGPQRMIHGYTVEDGQLFDSTLAPFHFGSPDTGMISTVPDLNTYFAALQKGELLTRQSVEEMHHPKYEEFGLGVVRLYDSCSNNVYFGHIGVVRGYSTLALISVDGSRQVAIAVARAPSPELIGFDDVKAREMSVAAVEALNLAC